MKNRIILTDIDGCCLDWEWAFSVWMQDRGFVQTPNAKQYYSIHDQFENVSKAEAKKYTRLFNESAAIGFLPALRDAVHYIKLLHEEHGYVFHAITSLSKDENACELRRMNLRKLFGETAFEKFIFLDTGADKDQALEPYRDSGLWWIEDKPINCEAGINVGLRSLLIEHGHNMDYDNPAVPRVKNWRKIHAMVTS